MQVALCGTGDTVQERCVCWREPLGLCQVKSGAMGTLGRGLEKTS